MPQKRDEQTKGTPARSKASTDCDDGAKALCRRFFRECPALVDTIGDVHRNDDHPVVRIVLWLGSQPIPFNEQTAEVQSRVPTGFHDSYIDTAFSLRADFSAALWTWGNSLADQFKKTAMELAEFQAGADFAERELKRLCAALKKRENKKWRDWPVPGWLVGWPEDSARSTLLEAIFRGQLDASKRALVLGLIRKHIGQLQANAQGVAVDHLKILTAKRKQPADSAAPKLGKLKSASSTEARLQFTKEIVARPRKSPLTAELLREALKPIALMPMKAEDALCCSKKQIQRMAKGGKLHRTKKGHILRDEKLRRALGDVYGEEAVTRAWPQ